MQRTIESSVKETIAQLEKKIESIKDPVKKEAVQKELDKLKKLLQRDDSICHV